MPRADTLDLKAKLADALGDHGLTYWNALIQFTTGKIDRTEFEELARKCLRSEHVHLHNALILGILYNATADVPGPSSPKLFAVGKHKREQSGLDAGEEDEDPKRKRLRTMVAGLSKKERQRLKLAGKPPKAGAGAVASAANLGWAGAGADMLEKKRKEEEKRKAAEEKRRVREATSAIGSRDWKAQTVQAAEQASAVSSKLSHSTQQALARALSAPLCIESKELPDLDMLRDRMTLIALEAGLPGGVHHQAAAMMLAALQGHLQNVASSVITKVRSNRSMGIRTSGDQRPASASPSKHSSYGLGGYRTSPSQMLHELDPPSPLAGRSAADSSRGSPIRMLRTVPSDLSSRTSTSGLAASFADTSTLSFASSAPTSFAPGSTGTAGDTEPSAVSDPSSEPDSYQSRSHGASLTLPDLAFLFELAPHTVVEPLGQGTHERLLAPDWEDEEETRGGHVDAGLAEVTRITATTKAGDELGPVRGRFIIDQTAPLRILDRRTLAETQAAEASSLGRRPTKGALTTPSGGGAGAGLGSLLGSGLAGKGAGSSVGANGGALQPLENRADVKQSMDAESGDGSAKRKDGGHGHQHQHRHKDGHSLWEVVDPVALLGPLCD